MTCPFKQKEAKSKTFRFVTSKEAPLLVQVFNKGSQPRVENTEPAVLWTLASISQWSEVTVWYFKGWEWGAFQLHVSPGLEGALTALQVAAPTSCPPRLPGEPGTFAAGFQMGITQRFQAEHTQHSAALFIYLSGICPAGSVQELHGSSQQLLICSSENERFEIIVHFPLTQTNSHYSDVFRVPGTGWRPTLQNCSSSKGKLF